MTDLSDQSNAVPSEGDSDTSNGVDSIDDYIQYKYRDRFEFLGSVKRLNGIHVELLCARPLYSVKLDDRPVMWEKYIKNLDHFKREKWSTHWLDIVFNSIIGEHKEMSYHDVFAYFINTNNERLQNVKAIPSQTFRGYYNLSDDWYTIYFLCPITDMNNTNIKRSFLVPLNEEERQCLNQRRRYNKRFTIIDWLLKKWT
jgi:hypothetical protein